MVNDMPRPPKDEVAASTTITLRLTPDDRQRIDRQIEARAADLPERSMSALLRRLVRDGEEGVLLRLTPEERALLDRLVVERTAELARLGVYEARVTPSSVVVGLIRDAARAKSLLAPGGPQASAPQVSAPTSPAGLEAPVKAAPLRPASLDPARVQAALDAAVKGGAKQADIARKTGIDSGHLSRFKRDGVGLSAEKLETLAKTLNMSARD